MTKTRRQSKKAADAAPESPEAGSSAREPSPAPVQSTMTVAIPEDVDFDLLSSILPDTRLDSPSPETIVSLYRLIVAQASEVDATRREVEEARAEVERKEVELDQALQDRESATKEYEATLESLQSELKQVKQERDELAASRAALQEQLNTVTSSQSASSTEVEALKQRIEETEREKRDLVGVVSRLKEDTTQRDEEIQNLRANLKQARQEHQALESEVREVRSTETSTKFKVESLSQQLQLAKDEAARTSADLAAKTEEFAKYRRAKHAEYAQLQAAHDSLTQRHTATESTLKALQSSHTAQSHQLAQALARIQDLTGQLAEQEATYSSEAAGLRRLVEMMEEREAQAKAIVDSIEKEWAGVGDRAERREVVLREEIEAQRQRAEYAEKRVQELQKVMDRLDRGEFPIPAGSTLGTPARGPATPMRNGTPDFLTQGMMGLSPTVAMASRAQRGGKTFTEVYSDYVRLQDEYAKKSAEYDHMDRTLSEVLAQIEERAPILAQQRQEYERLQSEASLLASQLSQALAERDTSSTAAEEASQKLAKSARENELLSKQLNDLGRQVQSLLKELGRRQDPSIPPDEELERDESIRPAENIEAVITNHLVLFQSIPALQEQNQKLLKIVRELGAKMEAEEKDYREALEREQGEAVREAHEAIKVLQEQLESHRKSSEVTIQAYMKERDSLKSMLERERRAPRGQGSGVNGHDEALAGEASTEGELADVQSHFEAFKHEMGIDSVKLRDEVAASQREAGQLSAALAKANAKIEYLNDRNRMLQDQTSLQSRELESLSKRNQELYDQYTRIDIECNRVSEDLLGAHSVVEQLRNESANLRAEKKIWESVQGRLVEENKTLAIERSHLSDLMVNVQKMHNDLERSGENDRRRLESQIQLLENQTQDLRAQLNQERDSLRHVSLQKDLELKELRTRIEKISQEHAKTREALVSAETSKKHLEEQVEQLSRQIQGKEEKLAVYERRSTAPNGTAQRDTEGLTREQQLEAEVAELRAALKGAEADAAAARSHVQQFQEISQANEAALAALNATYDEYKASTEAQIARQESEYNALQERLQALQSELAQVTAKNAELQKTLETERAAWASDKKTLEDTIVDMTTSERSTESERASRESEVRQQEERAKTAEERYAREVMSHAESIKTAEELRQQLAKVQASARDHLAAAETAQAKLASSEASWKQQKEALEKEIADLSARNKDLAQQNNLLHQHLETVSTQAARIRQAADSSAAPVSGESDATADTDTKLGELRSVVAYLRKEKEIVDLQLELSKQENARLRAQIDHLSQSLDETRKTLSEERERAVEAAASEAQHAELVERINQLTILRESNSTLRADCEAQAKRARALDDKLRQVSAELDPVKEQLRVTQAELEARNQHVQRLEQESRRWQERNAQLLSKYDRIDPAEVQSLKEEIDRLSSSKAEHEKEIAERDQRIQDFTAKITSLEAAHQKLKELSQKNNQIFRSRMEKSNAERAQCDATIADLQNQIRDLTAERDQLKAQMQGEGAVSTREQELSQQLEALRQEKITLEKALADERASKQEAGAAQASEQSAVIANLQQERDQLLREKAAWEASGGTATKTTEESQWATEKSNLLKSRELAMGQVQRLKQEIENMRQANEKCQTELKELKAARIADSERAAAQEKAAVEAAVSKLRSELPSAPAASSDEIVARELRALEERLTKQHQDELKSAVEAAAAAGANATPNGSAVGDQKAAIDAAVAAREQEFKATREQELAQAVERGRMEAAAKGKLKDSQLVKAQNRLKELEGQIREWINAGLVQAPPSFATTAKPAGATTTKPATTSATPTTAPTNAKSAPTAPKPAAGSSSGLPARPASAPQGAGRGGKPPLRGGARGGAAAAAAAALQIRGTAQGQVGAQPAEGDSGGNPGAAGGVSIIGAAAKRGREEGEASGDDSLAKRLKPAEGASKPVQLRRDRVPHPS